MSSPLVDLATLLSALTEAQRIVDAAKAQAALAAARQRRWRDRHPEAVARNQASRIAKRSAMRDAKRAARSVSDPIEGVAEPGTVH